MAFVAVAGRFPFLQLKGEMVPTAISLESKLKGLARNNKDAEMLYGKYCEVKRYLTESYYNWIQASSPFLTDHGERHIESVIHAASCLLYDYHNDALRREPSALELYLLLSAILWHDVGNVHGRSGHAERVPEMAQEIARLAFPDITIQRLVSEIAIAHSGPAGVSRQ